MLKSPAGRALTITVLAIGSLHCAAGADSEAASGSLERIDACELLPKSEVEAIVGTPVPDADPHFTDHSYTKPVTYTAGCIYGGDNPVILAVHYPMSSEATTSEQLAARLTKWLKEEQEAEEEASIAGAMEGLAAQPVSGVGSAAAAYDFLGTTTLDAMAGSYQVKVTGPSLDVSRRVAQKVIERLD
jgi:hypothetical protein